MIKMLCVFWESGFRGLWLFSLLLYIHMRIYIILYSKTPPSHSINSKPTHPVFSCNYS